LKYKIYIIGIILNKLLIKLAKIRIFYLTVE
jgi:hypothetical protein